MPSRQQKFTKKGSERYLMFGTNHFLVTLRWDDGLLLIQTITGSVRTKKTCVSWKLVKRIVFSRLRANKRAGWSEYSIRFA